MRKVFRMNRGRVSRSRYIRFLMALGIQRNEAALIAELTNELGWSYKFAIVCMPAATFIEMNQYMKGDFKGVVCQRRRRCR